MQDSDIEELQRIWDLKEKGAISNDEYATLKNAILNGARPADSERKDRSETPVRARTVPGPVKGSGRFGRQLAIIAAAAFGVIFIAALIGSIVNPNSSVGNTSGENAASTDTVASVASNDDGRSSSSDESALSNTDGNASEAPSPWDYSQDEDKVRGGTTYYARTTSTNSISQSFPYDSDTTMTMTVRKSPAYGTDVVLTISSGQMMCPSYEGCSGTVRFDNGRAQRVSFNGPADDSSDTVFVSGAKGFIAKLKSAKKVTIEKTLYEAGSPQFEFDVHGLKWDH
jgi:hypothetical protein